MTLIQPHGGKLVETRHDGPLPAATLALEPDRVDEVWNLVTGALSPLDGFVGKADFASILERGRLSDGTPWTVPIVLPASPSADRVTLTFNNKPVAVLDVREVYDYSKDAFAERVFGTQDAAHPGVARLATFGDKLVAGRVALVEPPRERLLTWTKTPRETRDEFARRGWTSVVAFQTRNIPHLGHEWAQRIALAGVDGLLVQPLAGFKKAGDFRDEVIFAAYQALVDHYYDPKRVMLSALHMPMRYAGPKEAILHAILRKNFGCSHFIVGRDHAGVGTYYDPFAAHRIFDAYPDLGVTPVRLGNIFGCVKCGGIVEEKSCGHGDDQRRQFSGTRLREALKGGAGAGDVIRPEVNAAISAFPNPLV